MVPRTGSRPRCIISRGVPVDSRVVDCCVSKNLALFARFAMQQNYRQRNHDIVQLCHAGASPGALARQFRITENRVHEILSREARDHEAAQRAERLARAFRVADDLDWTWPVEDLLDALALPTPTRRALEFHWAGKAVPTNRVSLRELMNLVVAPTSEGLEYLVIPALEVRGVGGFGFRALLNGIQRLNLGGVCREEWLKRFDLEAHSWRIRGGEDYYWSMPNPMRRAKAPQ